MSLRRKFFGLFFDSYYLNGYWFDNGVGWGWCIRGILYQKLLGFNRGVPFPVSPSIRVSDTPNIDFFPEDLDNFQQVGNYFQCNPGRISIGRGTKIAPGVGIITQNHSKDDPSKFLPPKGVIIGSRCWIGMNAMILPGVTLGDNTIVGAGAVVTKSFPKGHCTVVGNPARMVL